MAARSSRYMDNEQGDVPYPPQMMMGGMAHGQAAAGGYPVSQQMNSQLQEQMSDFWANQAREVDEVTEFKAHSLPLARIKKIMKADEDVRMISGEAPVLFAKACEMFILELTLRAWNHTEESKRRTLQKNDIAAAVQRTDIFDFLVDIVPRDDMKDETLGMGRAGGMPMGPPGDMYHHYMAPPPPPGMMRPPGAPYVDPGMYGGQRPMYMAPMQGWNQQEQQQQAEEPAGSNEE